MKGVGWHYLFRCVIAFEIQAWKDQKGKTTKCSKRVGQLKTQKSIIELVMASTHSSLLGSTLVFLLLLFFNQIRVIPDCFKHKGVWYLFARSLYFWLISLLKISCQQFLKWPMLGEWARSVLQRALHRTYSSQLRGRLQKMLQVKQQKVMECRQKNFTQKLILLFSKYIL